ncbi:MAG TPA: hypothetical protein VJR92_04965 [Gemmatimonadaceae bacterium]|nr:hypothetical protein [Gemmatimonadaceae bacterium]
MNRLNVALVLLVAGLLAADAGAQDKPNFAGRWSSVDTASAGRGGGRAGGGAGGGGAGRGGRGGDMGSGWGTLITVTQDAGRLTVEYAFFTRGDMQAPLKFIYALDGSETKNSVMMGRGIQQQASRTAWDGDKLVITTVHTFPNPETGTSMTTEVKQTLSLESPTSMVVETARAAVLGGAATSTRTVYNKL